MCPLSRVSGRVNAVPYHIVCFGRTRAGAVPIPSFTGKRVWLVEHTTRTGGVSPLDLNADSIAWSRELQG